MCVKRPPDHSPRAMGTVEVVQIGRRREAGYLGLTEKVQRLLRDVRLGNRDILRADAFQRRDPLLQVVAALLLLFVHGFVVRVVRVDDRNTSHDQHHRRNADPHGLTCFRPHRHILHLWVSMLVFCVFVGYTKTTRSRDASITTP